MSPTIPADVQERVNALLGTGRYASEAEILRAAVTALKERNADLAAIQSGINDMENGRCQPFAGFDAEFRKRNQFPRGMIRAILKKGKIEPLDALPEHWRDGQELTVEGSEPLGRSSGDQEMAQKVAGSVRQLLSVAEEKRKF